MRSKAIGERAPSEIGRLSGRALLRRDALPRGVEQMLKTLHDPKRGNDGIKQALGFGGINKFNRLAFLACVFGLEFRILLKRTVRQEAISVTKRHQSFKRSIKRVGVGRAIRASRCNCVVHFTHSRLSERQEEVITTGEVAVKGCAAHAGARGDIGE